MSLPILDYKPQLKELIQNYYEPPVVDSKKVIVMSLHQLFRNLAKVLPEKSFSENELFEVLAEIGYKPSLEKMMTLEPPESALAEAKKDEVIPVYAIQGTEKYNEYLSLGYIPDRFRQVYTFKFNRK